MVFAISCLVGSASAVLMFCFYMIRRSALAEGQSREMQDNEEYNRKLQEEYAATAYRPVQHADALLQRMRTDGEDDKLP